MVPTSLQFEELYIPCEWRDLFIGYPFLKSLSVLVWWTSSWLRCNMSFWFIWHFYLVVNLKMVCAIPNDMEDIHGYHHGYLCKLCFCSHGIFLLIHIKLHHPVL